MSRIAAATSARRVTSPVLRHDTARSLQRWLDWLAFKAILVSFGAFVVTSGVSLLGFFAVMAGLLDVAEFLGPVLPLSGGFTALAFVVAGALHLGAVFIGWRLSVS